MSDRREELYDRGWLHWKPAVRLCSCIYFASEAIKIVLFGHPIRGEDLRSKYAQDFLFSFRSIC